MSNQQCPLMLINANYFENPYSLYFFRMRALFYHALIVNAFLFPHTRLPYMYLSIPIGLSECPSRGLRQFTHTNSMR